MLKHDTAATPSCAQQLYQLRFSVLMLCLLLPAASLSAQTPPVNESGNDSQALDIGARRKANAERAAEAEKSYARAVALLPRDVEIGIKRAANFVRLGDHVNAALEYRRVFNFAPEDERAAHGYVRSILYLGAADGVLEQYHEQLQAHPEDFVSRLLFAELLRGEARYDKALNQYWLARRRAPNNRVAIRGAARAQAI